jgi:hypothetical protein
MAYRRPCCRHGSKFSSEGMVSPNYSDPNCVSELTVMKRCSMFEGKTIFGQPYYSYVAVQ